MTPPDDDPPAPPPKRRRKPPRGLEGFDTGYPDDDDATSSPPMTAAPRRPIWNESSQGTPSTPSEPVPAGAVEASVVVDPVLAPTPPIVDVPPEPPFEAVSAIPTEPSQPTYAAVSPSLGYSTIAAQLDREEPLSSAYVSAPDGDLRDAVGAKPKKSKPKPKRARTRPPTDDVVSFDDDDFTGGTPRSRKTIIVAVLSLVAGLGVAALIFLGRANSAYFYLSCEPDKIIAQQGRSFPPWGEAKLDGKPWAAIKIPPEAECIPLETEDEDELANRFREMLVKRASVLLTAKEVTKTDEANALLEQALLHARSNTDAARNARTEIQRLLGDVVYWRASLKMRDASKALVDAAKQFDAAAQQRPRHVTDASAWADYVRKVVGELEAGPSGTSQTSFPPTPPASPDEPRPPAPAGVALPVEPDGGSATEAPPPTPDAGLPTGGVLL